MSLKLGKHFSVNQGADDKDEDFDLELQDHHDPTINVSLQFIHFLI